ncbi:hypothetical protein E2C01_063149 [Portunus trituberculatus]|uniref:Uncharacterized protein n=1 Tax=Portunus trituberculatus TaxID=210409 RepID=A0A5B7HJH9_PORTR|nr:hypothetical protein [Portunus trituberculatus]
MLLAPLRLGVVQAPSRI